VPVGVTGHRTGSSSPGARGQVGPWTTPSRGPSSPLDPEGGPPGGAERRPIPRPLAPLIAQLVHCHHATTTSHSHDHSHRALLDLGAGSKRRPKPKTGASGDAMYFFAMEYGIAYLGLGSGTSNQFECPSERRMTSHHAFGVATRRSPAHTSCSVVEKVARLPRKTICCFAGLELLH
jgi:hypothetical protein